MEAIETLEQYYEMTCRRLPPDLRRTDGLSRHFNVFERVECFKPMPFRRRGYYKINLCKGRGLLYTEKGEVQIDKPALFFSSPIHKFGWRNISREQQGFVCLFNELYIKADLRNGLRKLNGLFKDEVYPFIELTDKQYALLYNYFHIMSDEYNGTFEYKEEIIQNMLRLIVYTAIKIRQTNHVASKAQKQHVLVTCFLDMLDTQFPVDSPLHPIRLKTPIDFASGLNVHVNHLNHVMKQYTGKSTSQIIAERKIAEAISLLRNTSWSVAEIGFSLGFEYPQYFNVFFKKLTGQGPRAYRRSLSVNI
jgi:AraC-like DNA-binding protein